MVKVTFHNSTSMKWKGIDIYLDTDDRQEAEAMGVYLMGLIKNIVKSPQDYKLEARSRLLEFALTKDRQ